MAVAGLPVRVRHHRLPCSRPQCEPSMPAPRLRGLPPRPMSDVGTATGRRCRTTTAGALSVHRAVHFCAAPRADAAPRRQPPGQILFRRRYPRIPNVHAPNRTECCSRDWSLWRGVLGQYVGQPGYAGSLGSRAGGGVSHRECPGSKELGHVPPRREVGGRACPATGGEWADEQAQRDHRRHQ